MALTRIDMRGDGHSQIVVVRRDTFELVKAKSMACTSMKELRDIAALEIQDLRKPADWDAPHRKCLAYFLKMRRKREYIFDLTANAQSRGDDIVKVLFRNEAYAFYACRKVNELTNSEKLKLLSPSLEELVEQRTTGVIEVLYARSSLFWLIFSRTPTLVHAYEKLQKQIIEAERL
ncbi:MAG: hypothetical protein ABI605_13125 [Rhizobacter sp.]